eukprot:c29265_g2_i4 orf=366-800(-)
MVSMPIPHPLRAHQEEQQQHHHHRHFLMFAAALLLLLILPLDRVQTLTLSKSEIQKCVRMSSTASYMDCQEKIVLQLAVASGQAWQGSITITRALNFHPSRLASHPKTDQPTTRLQQYLEPEGIDADPQVGDTILVWLETFNLT